MLQKRFLGVVLVLTALVVAGCGSAVQFVPVDNTVYESRAKDYPIYVHTTELHKPHVVLGTLVVEKKLDAGYNGYSTYDLMVDMLKDKARRVGGDALINIRPVDSEKRVDTTVVLSAQVVRYLEREKTITAQ